MDKFEAFIGVDFWTALFTLLNFLALFFVLKHFLYGPVMKMIHGRQKEIEDKFAQADDAEAKAKAMETEYQEKLTAASETGEQIVRDAVARGQRREEEILRQANADASAIMDKASADIAMEKKKAINDAKDEISDIAMSIAEKVVAREINPSDHEKLVDGFIDELG